jgi:hypothetical protein
LFWGGLMLSWLLSKHCQRANWATYQLSLNSLLT